MSRPNRPFTDKDFQQIKAMAGLGITLERMATVLGFSKTHLYNQYKTNDELKQAYDSGKTTVEIKVSQALVNKALAGHLGSIIWLEKTRYGRKEPSEISELEALRVLIEAGMLPTELAQIAAGEIESMKEMVKAAISAALREQMAEELSEDREG